MDAGLTWNVTCPLPDPVAVSGIISQSVYQGMNPKLQPGELQYVYVYELCGEGVAFSPYPPSRRLQNAESMIRLKVVVEASCETCEDDLFNEADQALVSIVSDGSLSESIQSNSGDVITAVIGDTVLTLLETVSPTSSPTVPPTGPPTNRPTASKSSKRSKTQKPVLSKSSKSAKMI